MLQEYDKKRKTRGILKANGNLSVRHQFKIALYLHILKIYLVWVFTFPLLSFHLEFKATGLVYVFTVAFFSLKELYFQFYSTVG